MDEKMNNFMEVANRAKKLIDMDVNGTLDKIAKNKTTIENKPTKQTMTNNFLGSTTSKLPTEILESLKTNPIEYGGMHSTTSVLDNINLDKLSDSVVTETNKAQSSVQVSNAPMIDYSLIKLMIEDCIRKEFKALNAKLLTENKSSDSGTLQAMKIGNKFSFITSNGDVYEAKLNFVKNIKKER